MGNAVPIDTLAYAKKLKAAGATEALAEAIASEHTHVDTSNLATKDDLNAVKQDLNAVKQDLNAVKDDLNAVKENINAVKEDINAVKQDMSGMKRDLKWIILIGGVIAASTIIPLLQSA